MNSNKERPWSSGLIRSYSEHAAVVLQHFQQHRHRPESIKYNVFGSELRNENEVLKNSNSIYEITSINNGCQSRQLLTSLSDNVKTLYNNQDCKIIQIGCGDSSALTSEFSELSLECQTSKDLKNQPVTKTSIFSTNPNALSTEPSQALSNDNSKYLLLGELKSNQEVYPSKTVVRAYSSSSALSGTSQHQRLNGIPILRHISYENWAREKTREIQRRRKEERRVELTRVEAEERQQQAKQLQEYERFLGWLKRKKREKLKKRELVEKKLELGRELNEIERKAQFAKSIGLVQWHKNKEKQLKATEKEELMKSKKTEEEKERRLQESLKAYEKWREKAKNAPRPATQGLLPHQKAKPAFTNPTPWKSLLDNVNDDSDAVVQIKTIGRTTKNSRSKRACVKR